VRSLAASELLGIWEQNGDASPAARALALLGASCPEDADELPALSVGARDSRLLALRELLFGTTLSVVATCPACREQLELSLRTDELRVAAAEPTDEPFIVEPPGWRVRARLVNAGDLLAIANLTDASAARRLLLARCVLEAERDGVAVGPDTLPDAVVDAIAARMEAEDPLGDARLGLCCPACGDAWSARFDATTLFWEEIEACAHRLLNEVHAIASIYGWDERDILAMSPSRRRVYLSLVGAS